MVPTNAFGLWSSWSIKSASTLRPCRTRHRRSTPRSHTGICSRPLSYFIATYFVLFLFFFRPFFRIVADILLGVARLHIADHSMSVQRLLSKVCTSQILDVTSITTTTTTIITITTTTTTSLLGLDAELSPHNI